MSIRSISAGSAAASLPRLLRPYAWSIAIVVGLLAALAVVNMALPFALKLLVDRVFPGPERAANWDLIWLILAGLALAYALRNVLFFFSRMISVRVGEDVAFRLRSDLFERLQRMRMDDRRSEQAGKMSARVMDDTTRILQFIQDQLPKLCLNTMTVAALVLVIFLVNWQLALASVLVLPLHFLTYRFFNRPIKETHALAQDNFASAHGSLVERLLGMEVVKGFTAEQRERRMFDSSIAAVRRAYIRSQRYHFGQKVAADLLIGVGTIILLGFGAWHVVEGVMTTGEFFMFFGYVMMLYPALLEGLGGASHMTRARASAERVGEVLAEEEGEGVEDAAPDDWPEVQGKVEFQDVRFSYDDGTEVLRGVSFTIEPGERVAIVGPSGCGKTTLANLLPRFREATSGRVLIDDQPIEDWPLSRLRAGVGMAFQEVFLFNCSLWENVLYGRSEATVEEVVGACQVTGAHDFISELPVGYGASPSGLGGRFSRGEKQRVTLARAILKRPRILVLDEATASLDPEAGAEVMQRIFEAHRDSTIILITHDPALRGLADRVIELTAQGTVRTPSLVEEESVER